MSDIVGPKTGSGSILGVVVLALSGWLAFGAWWFLLAPDRDAEATESQAPDRWKRMERDLRQLRSEVETLRRGQERLAARSLAPSRGAEAAAGGEEAADGTSAVPELTGKEDAVSKKERAARVAGKKEWDGELWARAQRLSEIADPEERRALTDELLATENAWMLSEGIVALLGEDPATAVAQLERLALLSDDGEKGPYALGRTLEALGEEAVVGAGAELRRLYDRGALDIAPLAAARAMERLGDPRPMQEQVQRAGQGLSADDPRQRIDSIERLGETGSAQAIPLLLPLLDHADTEVRLRAVEALGRVGGRAEIARIEALLDDPVAAVRDRAVQALSDLRRRWAD